MSVTLWNDKAEAQFDWPPLRMLLPLHELHDWMYPQRGTAPIMNGIQLVAWFAPRPLADAA